MEHTLQQERDHYLGTGTAQAKEAKDGNREKVSLNRRSYASRSKVGSSMQPKEWDTAHAGKGEKRKLY